MNKSKVSSEKTFAINLRKILESRGIPQYKLADDLGHTPATVSYWCSGRKVPGMLTITEIANYLGISLCDLFRETDGNSEAVAYRMKVPVTKSGMNGDISVTFVEEYFLSDAEGRKADYAIIAEDDSMSPRILKGDIILCSNASVAANGDLVAVDIDGKRIVRRLFKSPSANSLVAESPSSAPMVFAEGQMPAIVGKPFLIQRSI